MKGISVRPVIALLVVAVIAGCSSDSSTAPTPRSLNVATEIAAMSNGSVGGIPGVSTLLSLPASTSLPTVVPSACTYSLSTQGFTCPTATVGQLTFDISYFLADASGQSQSAPNVATTASIRAVADTHGTVAGPTFAGSSVAVTLTDHTDLTMSGLLGASRLLNGTSTSHYDVVTTGTVSAHAFIDMTTAAANVALPQEGAASSWPLSGTVTSNATAITSIGFAPSVTTTAQAVITFNGTSSPTVVVTVAGVVQTFKVDLTGRTPPNCS